MLTQSPYQILQIQQTATPQQIRQRYLLLSKTFHPDKQPFENYQIAKQFFQKIDKAYKSISSPLRKYIFNKFGIIGINILDENYHDFMHLQKNLETQWAQKEIEQNILFYYSQQQKQVADQNTKTEALAFLLLTLKNNQSLNSNSSVLKKTSINYTSGIPEFEGFQNNYNVSIYSTSQQTLLGLNLNSVRRIKQDILMKNTAEINYKNFSFTTQFSKNLRNNVVVRVIPISYYEQQLYPMKFGIQKSFENQVGLYIQTNYKLTELYFSVSKQYKRHSQYINFSFRESQTGLSTGFQYELSRNCKFFMFLKLDHINQVFNFINGLHYGFKYKFSEFMKIQIKSRMGVRNFIQIDILKQKYHMRIPIVIPMQNQILQQLVKISVMIILYAIQRMSFIIKKQNFSNKQKILRQNYIRLTDQRSKFNRFINDKKIQQEQIFKFQYATNGLIIIKAIYGSLKNVHFYQKKYKADKKIALKKWKEEDFVQFRNMHRQKFQDNQSQILDVTKLIQINVKGAQLINYKLDTSAYNPCIDQNQKPFLFMKYYLRGKVYSSYYTADEYINIGTPYRLSFKIVNQFWNWVQKNRLY